MADKDAPVVTYQQMREVAQEIHRLEKQARQIRTGALIFTALLVGTAVFAGVIALLVSAFQQTEIKDSDGTGLTMVKKDSNKVVATAQSVEDIDASDLIDYARTGKDADGKPDGEWTLTDNRIAQIRSVSWKAGTKMEVHHIAEIMRYDGLHARVEMVTKAGHKITVWDSDGVDNFDCKIQRYNKVTRTFATEEEVNPNGDENNSGRGRILVSLNRPQLDARPRPISADDYWDDDVSR